MNALNMNVSINYKEMLIRIYRNWYYYLLIHIAPISYKKIESNTKQKNRRELGSNPYPKI